MSQTIRAYTKDDVESIKACLIELQDFERMIDPRRLKGIEIAHEYLEHLMEIGAQNKGTVFVVEIDGNIVGMISVYIEEDKKHFRKAQKFAYISDMIILPEYTDKGISKELLGKAEEYAQSKNVSSIQTSVLAKHTEGIDNFQRNGYHNFEIILRKNFS